MTRPRFAKALSANDIGATGGHQAGICVPKSDPDLLRFLPKLDAGQLNPDAWIVCEDDNGEEWRLRYIYYNNRQHTPGGTRNEYRITHLTRFLKDAQAAAGDSLVFTATPTQGRYRMSLERAAKQRSKADATDGIIRLSGWRRIH